MSTLSASLPPISAVGFLFRTLRDPGEFTLFQVPRWQVPTSGTIYYAVAMLRSLIVSNVNTVPVTVNMKARLVSGRQFYLLSDTVLPSFGAVSVGAASTMTLPFRARVLVETSGPGVHCTGCFILHRLETLVR